MAEGGYDTASYIYNVYSAADSAYGSPAYWMRYFSPSPNGTVDQSSSHANSECRSDWDSGAKHLSPITSPTQSRLSGTAAEGMADAQTFASALVSVYQWVAPLNLPANDILYCWLDLESSTSLSTTYWSGWSSYLNTYDWEGLDNRPLYASLYCNPCGGSHHNCSTIGSAGGCFAVWSSEPESGYCGYSLRSLPAWHAANCSGCGSTVPTVVWQFAEKGVCGLSVNVDMDEGTLTPYSFLLSARP